MAQVPGMSPPSTTPTTSDHSPQPRKPSAIITNSGVDLQSHAKPDISVHGKQNNNAQVRRPRRASPSSRHRRQSSTDYTRAFSKTPGHNGGRGRSGDSSSAAAEGGLDGDCERAALLPRGSVAAVQEGDGELSGSSIIVQDPYSENSSRQAEAAAAQGTTDKMIQSPPFSFSPPSSSISREPLPEKTAARKHVGDWQQEEGEDRSATADESTSDLRVHKSSRRSSRAITVVEKVPSGGAAVGDTALLSSCPGDLDNTLRGARAGWPGAAGVNDGASERRTRKQVTLCMVIKVYLIPQAKEYTESEARSVWYSRSELAVMRGQDRARIAAAGIRHKRGTGVTATGTTATTTLRRSPTLQKYQQRQQQQRHQQRVLYRCPCPGCRTDATRGKGEFGERKGVPVLVFEDKKPYFS